MNERGQYGTSGQAPQGEPRTPMPWWGNVLANGLAIGILSGLGYVGYSLVKDYREHGKDLEREKRIRAKWSPANREEWRESGLTTDAFQDWLKTGRGMTVNEWLLATPEKG